MDAATERAALFQNICAIVIRALFVLVSLTGVWRVVCVKKDNTYWHLAFLFLPLVTEMLNRVYACMKDTFNCIKDTLFCRTYTVQRGTKEKDCKWFSLPIFLFLISIIPSMWLLELHHQHNKITHQDDKIKCRSLDSWKKVAGTLTVNDIGNASAAQRLEQQVSFVCLKDWIMGLHQSLLILLIIGNWLLPAGGVTRDKLPTLVLTFVGTAADILEFTTETLSDVKEEGPSLAYVILAVWTWSMLQFPFHLSVVDDSTFCCGALSKKLQTHSTDLWEIVQALFIQDGPFLVVRVTVMSYYDIYHQMLGFYAIKNLLVVILNLYRLVLIYQEIKRSDNDGASGENRDEEQANLNREHEEDLDQPVLDTVDVHHEEDLDQTVLDTVDIHHEEDLV